MAREVELNNDDFLFYNSSLFLRSLPTHSYEEALRFTRKGCFSRRICFGPGARAEIGGLNERGDPHHPPPGPVHCLVSKTQPWEGSGAPGGGGGMCLCSGRVNAFLEKLPAFYYEILLMVCCLHK